MFETGYVFERDIQALGLSIEEAVEKYDLCELEAPGLPERVFKKKSNAEFFGIFDIVPKVATMDVYEDYFCGRLLEYGRRVGFCALNALGLSTQVCFSLELKSVLVSEETVLDVCGAKLTIHPAVQYDNSHPWEDLAIESLNEYLGYLDYCREAIFWRWEDSNLDLDYIYAGLNEKARKWWEG